MGRLLREPLLHFFALGALIFLASSLGHDRPDERSTRIVVTRGQIAHLADGFARTWQRTPTAAELDGLVDEYVRDEIYYREGMALGIERDDSVIRRRLRQKMEFVVEDAAAGPPPSDAELQRYLDAHPDAFRRAPEVSFRQVYLDRDRRGAGAADEARALAARLRRSGPDFDTQGLGDAIMLPSDFDHVGDDEVARTFGDGFADALAALPISEWTGPIESGYGLHVVFVRNRTAGRVPALAEVRDAVARELTAAARTAMIEKAYAGLRARYEVVIEPPTAENAVAAQ